MWIIAVFIMIIFSFFVRTMRLGFLSVLEKVINKKNLLTFVNVFIIKNEKR